MTGGLAFKSLIRRLQIVLCCVSKIPPQIGSNWKVWLALWHNFWWMQGHISVWLETVRGPTSSLQMCPWCMYPWFWFLYPWCRYPISMINVFKMHVSLKCVSRNRNWKNLVPKKVSEPVSKKFGTEKSLGTGFEIFLVPKKSRNRSRKNLLQKKNIGTSLEIFQNISVDLGPGLVPFPGFLQFFYGIGTGLKKNLVPKKVSELVSKKFTNEKK